jgi:SAM-dependent methyltransferase
MSDVECRTVSEGSLKQQAHYETIHDDYEAHYYDASSMEFRERFIYDVMFADQDFNGLHVADLACGSGHNSLALLERFPRAEVSGFDISPRACDAYRTVVGREATQLDLTAGTPAPAKFDAAMIFGGLHHCVSDLDGTFRTIADLIRPGGVLVMCEPNRECFLEGFRRLWYRMDRYFEQSTEQALSHGEILARTSSRFESIDCRYLGGPAYFLIFNSLVLRVPLRLKSILSRPLFAAERAYNRLPGKFAYPYFVARWRRRSDPSKP